MKPLTIQIGIYLPKKKILHSSGKCKVCNTFEHRREIMKMSGTTQVFKFKTHKK